MSNALKQKYIEIVDKLNHEQCKRLLVAALMRIEELQDSSAINSEELRRFRRKLEDNDYDPLGGCMNHFGD